MKIGFIGCGTMGEHMCRNILRGGYPVAVYDIQPAPVERLVADGAIATSSPKEVAAQSDTVILMVVSDQQVRDVISGADGILAGLAAGGRVVIMSTVSPAVCVEMSAVMAAADCELLEAPVVWSQPAAISGDLGIYVGSNAEAFEAIKPVLGCMGKNIIHMGGVGAGMAMKLCHNMLAAIICQGVSETLVLGQKAGLSVESMAQAVAIGGAHNAYLVAKAGSLAARDFAPKFALGNMHKDMGLVLQLAEGQGACLPIAASVKQLQNAAMASGLGVEDFSAAIKVVERLLGVAETTKA